MFSFSFEKNNATINANKNTIPANRNTVLNCDVNLILKCGNAKNSIATIAYPKTLPILSILVTMPSEKLSLPFSALCMAIELLHGIIICSPTLKIIISPTTGTLAVDEMTRDTIAIIHTKSDIFNMLFSLNLYKIASINISSRPGSSRKNSTTPLWNSVIWAISAR